MDKASSPSWTEPPGYRTLLNLVIDENYEGILATPYIRLYRLSGVCMNAPDTLSMTSFLTTKGFANRGGTSLFFVPKYKDCGSAMQIRAPT